MKTQNNILDFKKKSITELNDNQLQDVNGGGTPLISIAASFLTGVIVGTLITRQKP